MEFLENFKEFIKTVVSEQLRDIREKVELYSELPNVATTQEVAAALKTSSEVVTKMCKEGLPHKHVGREYRFNKQLLDEWTRNETVFSCAVCEGRRQDEPPADVPSVLPAPPVEIASFKAASQPTREEKLAQMLR